MSKLNVTARRLFRLGIRQKMIIVLLCVLSISLTITGWITLSEYRESAFREVQIDGNKLTHFAAESLIFSVVGYDYHTIQLMLDKLITSPDIAFAEVKNARGKVMASAGQVRQNDENVKLFYDDIVFEKEKVGQLTIGFDTTRIVNDLDKQKTAVIRREGLIILLIAIGEFFAISFIVVRPVGFIHRFLKGSSDNLHQRIPPLPLDTRDEFSDLADVFNHMLDNLERRQNELRFALGQAEQATRAKSAFLANVSHQFRTPLNAVLGYAQLLQRELGENSPHRRALETINRSGNELLTLVNEIINVSKMESGQADVTAIDFDLAVLLKQVATTFEAACQKKNLTWRCDALGDASTLPVNGDASKIREALNTLLENAVMFTEQGTVQLQVVRNHDTTFTFTVTDTGIGISDAQQKTLFTAFADDEQRLAAGGSSVGISLALAHKQVEVMGGKLTVKSAPGSGAQFSFTLPLAAAAAPIAACAESIVDENKPGAIDVVAAPNSAPSFANTAIPTEMLSQIEEMAEMGLLSELQAKITELKSVHSQFAEHLSGLAEKMQFDDIAELARKLKN